MPNSFRRRLIALLLAASSLVFTSSSRALPEEPWGSGWPPGQSANQTTALAVAPSEGKVLYASTAVGLYRSTDGGTKWAVASDLPNIVAIAVDPAGADTRYAYLWPQLANAPKIKGLRRSTDGGRTWSDPSEGMAGEAIGRATALAIDRTNPQVIHAGSVSEGDYGLLRSTDAYSYLHAYLCANAGAAYAYLYTNAHSDADAYSHHGAHHKQLRE